MANPQQTPVSASAYDAGDRYDNTAADAGGGGCCFRRFCFFGRDKSQGYSYLLHEDGGAPPQPDSWFIGKLKKLRELSEVVAGPKWKNLIRKMGRICNPKKQNKTDMEYQYSPESYALNFAGLGVGYEEDGELLHSFSTRFASGFSNNDRQKL